VRVPASRERRTLQKVSIEIQQPAAAAGANARDQLGFRCSGGITVGSDSAHVTWSAFRRPRRGWNDRDNDRAERKCRRQRVPPRMQTLVYAFPADAPPLPLAHRGSDDRSRMTAGAPNRARDAQRPSLPQLRPEVDKDLRRQNVTQNDVDDHASRERIERLTANRDELPKPGGQTDRKKRERERPGPQRLQWRDERGLQHLLVVRITITMRNEGHDGGCHQESEHEFRKASPDLHRIGLGLNTGALPS